MTDQSAPAGTDLAQVTAAWLVSRRSPHTRRAYAADFNGWLRWCAAVELDPLAVRRRHVQVWVAQQQAELYAAATIARKLASVSSWYRALAAEELVSVVPTLEVDRAPVDVDDSAVLGLDQGEAVALLRPRSRPPRPRPFLRPGGAAVRRATTHPYVSEGRR